MPSPPTLLSPARLARPRRRPFRALGLAVLTVAVLGLVVGSTALVVLASRPAEAAKAKATKGGDLIWTNPDYARLGVESIAILPAVTYDNDLHDERVVEAQVGQALHGMTYRWVGSTVARELVRTDPRGDSLIKAYDEMVLKNIRVDSLAAPRYCARLRTDAVLSVRVDLFEKVEMEFNQAGKPSTTVQLKAALVDSLGRLLWTASGSETMEGTYHDPSAGAIGVRSSTLNAQPITGQAGAPRYEEVLAKMLTRWAAHFPAPAGVAATGSPAPAEIGRAHV